MPNRLVHVTVEITLGGAWGWRGRWWVEVCEGDDLVAIGEAVEDGEEGVFAAGDESDDVEALGSGHARSRLKVRRFVGYRDRHRLKRVQVTYYGMNVVDVGRDQGMNRSKSDSLLKAQGASDFSTSIMVVTTFGGRNF